MYIVNIKQVDLVLFGHVHNYERTCSVYQNKCKAIPIKDQKGVDTYDNRNYSAPVHAVIGMAGFALDKFSNNVTNFPFVTLFFIMIVLNCGYGRSGSFAAKFDISAKYCRPMKQGYGHVDRTRH